MSNSKAFVTEVNTFRQVASFATIRRPYRSFREEHKFWKEGRHLTALLRGQITLEYYQPIVETMDCDLLEKPHFITRHFSFISLEKNNPIFGYIVKSIR